MKIKTAFFLLAACTSALAITSFTIGDNAIQQNEQKTIAAPDTSDTKKVVIDEQYSMRVPKRMTASKELNDDASLQYQDTGEELYVIVIDEPTKEFRDAWKSDKSWDPELTVAQNYRKVQVKSLTKAIKLKGKPVIQTTKAGSVPMEIVDFTGKVKGIDVPISYKLGFLETDGNVYMIMSWTLASRKSFHNEVMEEMLKSFRSEK
jgi:hypothetical protein